MADDEERKRILLEEGRRRVREFTCFRLKEDFESYIDTNL